MKPILAWACSLSCAAAAWTDTTVEGFDVVNGDEGDKAGWAFGGPNDEVFGIGGDPDGWFGSPGLDVQAVTVGTRTPQSLFLGDYAARNVVRVGLDAILLDVMVSAKGMRMSVVLFDDNGTPMNYFDDTIAFYTGREQIPQVGQGWRRYDFEVPSQAAALPPQWRVIAQQVAPDRTPDEAWRAIISDVDCLMFWWCDPALGGIVQVWEPGVDNLTIETAPECPFDLDGSGSLDVFDFLAFVNLFNAGDPGADCDGNQSLDLFDFLCFVSGFNAGC